jgi:hypothetical protein
MGHEPSVAYDCKTARALASSLLFDVILANVELSDGDGRHTCDGLRMKGASQSAYDGVDDFELRARFSASQGLYRHGKQVGRWLQPDAQGCGTRIKQKYVCPDAGKVVERADMVKDYEFEKEKYVIFEKSELEALEASASHIIDIVSFMPTEAIDPIDLDKPCYLAPDKRGGKPYRLLQEAMKDSGTCALARWTWKGSSTWCRCAPATTA